MANEEYDQYGWQAGNVQLWDASDGDDLARLDVKDAVSIAFSLDSRILATGSFDGTLRLWEVNGLGLLFEVKGHYDQIQRVQFTPDGASLLSGSQDGTILRWGIPNQSSDEEPLAIGNWQTYTSERFGFNIDYPSGWDILEVPNADYETDSPQIWFAATGFPPRHTGARADIVLLILDEDPTPNWQPEFLDNYLAETILLGGREALRISGINKESLYQEVVIVAEMDGYYIAALPNNSAESLAYFDRMLSTLR
jgi:hypothetical protein